MPPVVAAKALLVLAVVGGGVAACGDEASTIDPARAAAVAAVQCERLVECAPFTFETSFADADDCRRAEAARLEVAFFSEGTVAPEARLDACVASVGSSTCEVYLVDRLSACTGDGGLPNGDACVADAQCASGACNKLPQTLCGVCGAVAALGEECGSRACAPGLRCLQGQCAEPLAQGGVCEAFADCAVGLNCVGGSCQPPLAAGEPCEELLACDVLAGFVCNPVVGVCQAALYAPPGEPCGVVDERTIYCRAGATCFVPQGRGRGVCTALAEDGEACSAQPGQDAGPTCIRPAICESGFCRRPFVGSCR